MFDRAPRIPAGLAEFWIAVMVSASQFDFGADALPMIDVIRNFPNAGILGCSP